MRNSLYRVSHQEPSNSAPPDFSRREHTKCSKNYINTNLSFQENAKENYYVISCARKKLYWKHEDGYLYRGPSEGIGVSRHSYYTKWLICSCSYCAYFFGHHDAATCSVSHSMTRECMPRRAWRTFWTHSNLNIFKYQCSCLQKKKKSFTRYDVIHFSRKLSP